MILPSTTKGFTTIYKNPLEPVEEGYGYKGVLTTNKEKTHLQCHICGYFFEHLGAHVAQGHDITANEYRRVYELSPVTPLVSESTRNSLIESRTNLTGDQKIRMLKILKQGRRKARPGTLGYRKTLEDRNKQGRCPHQLLDKIEALAKKLNRSPALDDFIAEYGTGMEHSVRNTFGSWSTAKKIVGLEVYTPGMKPYWTPPDLIDILRSFKQIHGRKAVSTDARLGLIPALQTYKRHLGSWAKAKALAYNKEIIGRE